MKTLLTLILALSLVGTASSALAASGGQKQRNRKRRWR